MLSHRIAAVVRTIPPIIRAHMASSGDSDFYQAVAVPEKQHEFPAIEKYWRTSDI